MFGQVDGGDDLGEGCGGRWDWVLRGDGANRGGDRDDRSCQMRGAGWAVFYCRRALGDGVYLGGIDRGHRVA